MLVSVFKVPSSTILDQLELNTWTMVDASYNASQPDRRLYAGLAPLQLDESGEAFVMYGGAQFDRSMAMEEVHLLKLSQP
jgi:hypothetical protein